jgi:hypothetical protein
MRLDEIEFEELYSKARNAFYECASDQVREIQLETGVSFESIKTVSESVRVTYWGNNKNIFTIETKLNLFSSDGRPLGWYCLHEDENGDIVDDFLVFD